MNEKHNKKNMLEIVRVKKRERKRKEKTKGPNVQFHQTTKTISVILWYNLL